MTDPFTPPYDLVQRMREQLRQLQDTTDPNTADAAEDVLPEGTGEALEGKVRVTVSGGRVSGVELDPRALRESSEDLAEAFQEAANTAIERSNAEVAAGLPGVPSLDRLSRDLEDISTDSMRAIEKSARGVRDAIGAVQRISELHRGRSTGTT